MRFLGIDYGKKKVGLALSDGQLASPFKIIAIDNLKHGLNKILQVIKSEQIEKIVIGIPESGEAHSITIKFIQELKKNLKDVEIVEVSETLSSFHARADMLTAGVSKSKRGQEDAVAAAGILQNYLDDLPS